MDNRPGGPRLQDAVEVWKAVNDRFYRRRELDWKVWLGIWAGLLGLVGTLIAGDAALSKRVAGVLGVAVVVFHGVWGFLTARASIRDNCYGRELWRRVRTSLGDLAPPDGVCESKTSEWRWGTYLAHAAQLFVTVLIVFVLTAEAG